jgi:predicted AlkP superfamily phosphohydrolase/phosphomutase
MPRGRGGDGVTRLIVLGLDGATFDLMLPWAEQGVLPTFAKLLEGGTAAELRSVPNMNTAPAWTTFMTGKNPGKHGIFWFAEEGDKPGTVRFVNGGDRRATTIWRLLSDAGKRVASVNVPLTFPAEHINGIQLCGFDAPSTASNGFSHPPTAITDLEREVGDYILHAAVSHHAGAGRLGRVVKAALEAEETRVKAALHVLEQEPWDVFMYMVKSTDQVAHHAWEYGTNDQQWMKPVYEYADTVMARFLEHAGPDCGVIVMSDHGMGWRQPAVEFLNEVLSQLGYVKRRDQARKGTTWRLHRLARRLGARTRGWLKRRFPGVYARFGYQVRFGGLDWAGTQAYCDDSRSCVWVNLEGRNPNGIVAPADYERLVEDLREVLLNLTDPETGENVVASVWRPHEIYTGPFAERAPDLQIDWRYDRPVTGLAYEGRLGKARSARAAKGFMHKLTGAHRRHGVLVTYGPQFRPGAVLDDVGLEDVAPTILHLAGVPVPDDMDGRVLLEALTDEHAARPVVSSEANGEIAPEPAVVYTAGEEAEVEERLRSLGYL